MKKWEKVNSPFFCCSTSNCRKFSSSSIFARGKFKGAMKGKSPTGASKLIVGASRHNAGGDSASISAAGKSAASKSAAPWFNLRGGAGSGMAPGLDEEASKLLKRKWINTTAVNFRKGRRNVVSQFPLSFSQSKGNIEPVAGGHPAGNDLVYMATASSWHHSQIGMFWVGASARI